MFKTIKAKYPGTCKRCGCGIPVGQAMRYGGYGRTYHLTKDCTVSQAARAPRPDPFEDPFGIDRAWEDQCAEITREY